MTLPRALLGLTLLLAHAGCSEAHSTGDAGNGDAGELTLDSCFAGIAPTGDAPWVGTQSFENDDGSVRVRLARQPGDRPSVGETYAYDMVRFGIERDGVVECITDQDALAYDFGHHNWNDTATAEGNGTYVVTMRFDVAAEPAVWVDALQINEAAPMTLHATACDATPLDLNHCLLRNMFP
ncbi:MAG: hypothetical protein IPI43_11670 [Sandaracinaceae bacterium]|nr:hypothetical protein [Sandaracinaceae bacterium]MBP7681336.1 hypothetical protein [Deltaproteobacteria bacterium]